MPSLTSIPFQAAEQAYDMAHEFPHTEVVGVDLTPVPADLEAIPPNCRFEIDDINLGLNHFKDSFDVVHTRFVGTGLKNFRKTMDDVHQCLKPGGIAIWADADFDMCAEDWHIYQPFALDEDEDNPDQTDRSWSQRISYEMTRIMKARQSDIDGMAKAMDEGLWLTASWIPKRVEQPVSTYQPMGTRRLGDTDTATGLHRDINAPEFNVMTDFGWDPEDLDRYLKLCDKELMNMNPKMWYRMCARILFFDSIARYAWGRRRAAENEPAPPLLSVPTPTPATTDARRIFRYPHFYIYKTREESLAAAALRNRGKDCTPPPPLNGVPPTTP
ncbi:SubName: Full=Uncharacterized protein {ECO:0000313/EMBL:CCA67105.1} [Serendipita indica DSM 11827]|nr:SubName: Full=Uncharacterized protein {ECO:0000313/EMBL:CCA67105.1} [Serendipita indica DSM 11827]